MDCRVIGRTIKALRVEQGLTQQALSERINVSDKAVSKWERGLGCPDVTVLPVLADALGVPVETILSGGLDESLEGKGVSMKSLRFFVCSGCGSITMGTLGSEVTCCGKRLPALRAESPYGDEDLTVEKVEGDYYVTSLHPMDKDHYVSFLALVSADSLVVKKLYPEWGIDARLPAVARPLLLWHCTRHGLFSRQL